MLRRVTRVAYVVMSYTEPQTLQRLIRALRSASPAAEIVVRHDARRVPLPEMPADGHLHARPSTAPLEWGHWSMVEAMLIELRWVRQNLSVTHVAFISGQDYPAGALGGWEAGLAGVDAVMTAERLAFRPRWLARRGVDGSDDLIRYVYAWFGLPGTSRRVWPRTKRGKKAVAKTFDQIRPVAYFRVLPHGRGSLVGIRRRPTAWSDHYYKGWPWVALSVKATDRVLTAASGPLRDLYRRSLIPEESFLQTVVMNDPDLHVVPQELAFMDWTGSVEHPQLLTLKHLPAISDAGTPFARKVAAGVSDDLMAAFDERLGPSSGRPGVQQVQRAEHGGT